MRGLLMLMIVMVSTAALAQPQTIWEQQYWSDSLDWIVGANTLCQTPDGGFLMAGEVYDIAADSSVGMLRKTDSIGVVQWCRTYPWGRLTQFWLSPAQAGSYVLMAWSRNVAQTSEGLVMGAVNEDGDTLWTSDLRYLEPAITNGHAVIETGEGYLVGGDGATGVPQAGATWLRLDHAGHFLGQNFYAGRLNLGIDNGEIEDIAPMPDGDYLLAGWFEPWYADSTGDMPTQALLIRINALGDTVWVRRFPLTAGAVRFEHVNRTTDGNYIASGADDWNYAVKVDSAGNTLWTREPRFGGCHSGQCATSDGGVFICATEFDGSWERCFLTRLTSEGDTLWYRTWGNINQNWCAAAALLTPQGEIAMMAHISSWSGPAEDIDFLTLLAPDTANAATPRNPAVSSEFRLEQNYPNPFNPTTEIRFELAKAGKTTLVVYDLLGREVVEPVNEVLAAGTHNITFDASALPSGIYFYRLHSGTQIQSRKMVVLK